MRNSLGLVALLALFLPFSFAVSAPSPTDSGKHPIRSGKQTRHTLSGDALRFVYRSYDGEQTHYCRHRLLSDQSPYDWKVECGDGKRIRSEYVIHVALSAYRRDRHPNLSVELLYWITSGSRIPSEIGTTTWMHFTRDSSIASISSSLTLDRGTAGLYLEIKGSALTRKRFR